MEKLANDPKKFKNIPVVIAIDELDRCRPLYAIELLEAAKHLFSVNNIVFVLATNRSELGHSIKAVYGEKFDSQEYLKRFIDVDFRLPDADRKEYISTMMSSKTRSVLHANYNSKIALDLIFNLFGSHEISLRSVAHYIHRLNILLASVGTHPHDKFVISAVVALVTRSVDSENYFKFNRGDISDEEFANFVFNRIGVRNLRQTSEGSCIEAVLISAQQDRYVKLAGQAANIETPLLRQYNKVRSKEALI